MSVIRNDWSEEEISEIYNTPLMELIYKAATVHREYHETGEVQVLYTTLDKNRWLL